MGDFADFGCQRLNAHNVGMGEHNKGFLDKGVSGDMHQQILRLPEIFTACFSG